MKRGLILAYILVSFTFLSNAQGNFGVHVGASIPIGYLSTDNPASTTGFNAGIKYFLPLNSNKRISLTLGVDYLNNGWDQTKKNYLNYVFDFYGMEIKKYPVSINIPVLAGINYKLPITHSWALFGDAAVGANYSTSTDLVMTGSTVSTKAIIYPAYQFGGGVLIYNRFTIGLHYNFLGLMNTTHDGTFLSVNGHSIPYSNEKLNAITLTIGVRI